MIRAMHNFMLFLVHYIFQLQSLKGLKRRAFLHLEKKNEYKGKGK